jgi:radical SAM protein with 4Fe4S-binding SPASM domain
MSLEDEKLFIGVEVEINSACNRVCSYCPNERHQRKEKGHMDVELFKILLQQLDDLGFNGKMSYHFYNEPLLSNQLEDFIRLTKEKLPGVRTEVYSNGNLLTQERFASLEFAGLDKFTITEHENENNYVFHDVYAALTQEQKKKVKFGHHSKLYLTNRGGLVPVGSTELRPPLARPCFIPSTTIVVTLKGNVLVCYEDYEQQTEQGNILENHLREIWNQESYQALRASLRRGERVKHELCKTCNNMQVI